MIHSQSIRRGSELISDIFGDREHFLSVVLRDWFAACRRFEDFVTRYKDKVRKKVRNAITNEDLEDLRFELQLPYLLLLDARFEVKYEILVSSQTGGPDFTVTFEGSTDFNVEVKRIRDADKDFRFDKWLEKVDRKIDAIPSILSFGLEIPKLESKPDLVDRLEASTEEIIRFITDTIRTTENELIVGSVAEYPIPGFQDEMVLILSKPVNKQDHNTSYSGGLKPIFYTQKEYRKFGDAICDVLLRQVRPGMINLLFLGSNSTTHEDRDLLLAIHSINQQNDAFFIDKGFASRKDFLARAKSLSGILFRSSWVSLAASSKERNYLWLNEQAEHSIPESIFAYLARMDKKHI